MGDKVEATFHPWDIRTTSSGVFDSHGADLDTGYSIWVRLALLLLRPIEIWHERAIDRAYAKGRFKRPDGPCVTTRRPL